MNADDGSTPDPVANVNRLPEAGTELAAKVDDQVDAAADKTKNDDNELAKKNVTTTIMTSRINMNRLLEIDDELAKLSGETEVEKNPAKIENKIIGCVRAHTVTGGDGSGPGTCGHTGDV